MKTQSIIPATLIGLFLLLNIVSSQTVSKLFFDFSTGKREAALEFLKRIQKEAYFPRFYSGVAGFFQENLEDEVFSETRKRQRKIKELAEILKQNPKARDALFSLYIELRPVVGFALLPGFSARSRRRERHLWPIICSEGETKTADIYLRQAKEIDPAFGGVDHEIR